MIDGSSLAQHPEGDLGVQPASFTPDILDCVTMCKRKWVFAVAALAATIGIASCNKGEQAVAGVAQKASNAEQKARAKAVDLETKRSEIAAIPLPTKSLYVDIHEPAAWNNPFLSVGPDMISLHIMLADANKSTFGEGTMLRPEGARKQEVQLRPADLANAIVAIPVSAWPYGRVIAVAETPAPRSDRPKVRRNVEAAIQQLNDLGIVVEEWPGR